MKGIREIALSKEETIVPQRKLQGYYDYDTDYDPYGGYLGSTENYNSRFTNNYGTKNKPKTAYQDELTEFELEEGEFEINLIVTMKELGKIADPDEENFTFEEMLDSAEMTAIQKVLSLNKDLQKKYKFTTSSVENIDDITVSIKLTPLTK